METILVVIEGGCLREVYCTGPVPVRLALCDFDDDRQYTGQEGDGGFLHAQLSAGNLRLDDGSVAVDTDRFAWRLTAEGPVPACPAYADLEGNDV